MFGFEPGLCCDVWYVRCPIWKIHLLRCFAITDLTCNNRSHGFSMCSLQIYVLFVFMRVAISLFNSGIVGSCGLFFLVVFMCTILLRMG